MQINTKKNGKKLGINKFSENVIIIAPLNIGIPKNCALNKDNYFSSPQTPKTKENSSLYFENPNKPYLPFYFIKDKIKRIKQQKIDYINSFHSNSLRKYSEKKNSNSIKLINISNLKISKDSNNCNNDNKILNNTKYLLTEKINSYNYKQNKIKSAAITSKTKNFINPSKLCLKKKINYKMDSPSLTTNSLLSTRANWNKSKEKSNNFSSAIKRFNLKNSNFLDSILGNSDVKKKIPIAKFYCQDSEDRNPLNLPTNYHLNSFENEVKLFRKINYFNYCLKEVHYKHLRKKELNEEAIKVQINFLFKAHKLITKYLTESAHYFKFLIKQLDKEKSINDFIKYDVITIKNEINSLSNKKDKLLSRLENYADMKQFLIDVKIFSDKQDKILSVLQSNNKSEKSENIKDIFCSLQNTLNSVNRKYSREKTIMLKRKSCMFLSIPKLKEKDDNKKAIKKLKTNNQIFYNSTYREKMKQISSNKEVNIPKKDSQSNKNIFLLNSNNKPIFNSVDEFFTITDNINHNIGLLLMYQTRIFNEMKPLRKEFHETYDLLEKSKIKYKNEIKMQFIILPKELKGVKDRNKSLLKKLENYKKNYINNGLEKKFFKIEQKLKIIYQNIYKTNIYPKKCELCGEKEYLENYVKIGGIKKNETLKNILFYLRKIELGYNLLAKSKIQLKENYPTSFEILKKKLTAKQRLMNYNNRQLREYETKQLHAKIMIDKSDNILHDIRGLNCSHPCKIHKKIKSEKKKKKLLFEDELETYFEE